MKLPSASSVTEPATPPRPVAEVPDATPRFAGTPCTSLTVKVVPVSLMSTPEASGTVSDTLPVAV